MVYMKFNWAQANGALHKLLGVPISKHIIICKTHIKIFMVYVQYSESFQGCILRYVAIIQCLTVVICIPNALNDCSGSECHDLLANITNAHLWSVISIGYCFHIYPTTQDVSATLRII